MNPAIIIEHADNQSSLYPWVTMQNTVIQKQMYFNGWVKYIFGRALTGVLEVQVQ
jgi:hypothetical protein